MPFPEDDVFAPLIAGPKEPRFGFSYRRVHFRKMSLPSGGTQDTIDAGVVSAGGSFGLWAHRQPAGCNGTQVSLLAGVFSQFNLDAPSNDLINSDFVVGTEITTRRGSVSGRLRLYHQSSHLGDEFVLRNPSIVRTDFGFQSVEGLLSYGRRRWRVYGGGGYLAFMTEGLAPWMLQGGAELRRSDTGAGHLVPVAGIDISSLQARDWGTTTSASAGAEWTSAAGARRMRVLFVFLDGFIPFGQFSVRQELQNAGLQLQIDF